MGRVVTLKNWCEGDTPEKNDVLSWSELIFQRALQIKEPGVDPVSQYFVSQWLSATKAKAFVLPVFERSFSAYGIRTQIALLNSLVSEKVLAHVDLVDYVKSNGPLHRHLLTLPEVWLNMAPHQLRDQLYSSFESIVQAGENEPDVIHPAWDAVQIFKTTDERNRIFDVIFSPKIRSAFGLFSDDRAHFNISCFHHTVRQLGHSWHIHPAQIMCGLLRVDTGWYSRDYDQYEAYVKPYSNDIRELIQFSIEPKDERIRQNLPASSNPISIDILSAFCMGADQNNIFLDSRHVPTAPNDLEAANALSAAVSF